MIIIVKLLLIGVLGLIVLQDFKFRAVLWFLFPTAAFLFGFLHVSHTVDWRVFAYTIGLNWALTTCVLAIVFFYTKLIAGKPFLGHSMGLGDILFFYAFAMGFPTFSFTILLVCTLLFTLGTYLLLKSWLNMSTVPLAGLMGLFLILVLFNDLTFNETLLYGY